MLGKIEGGGRRGQQRMRWLDVIQLVIQVYAPTNKAEEAEVEWFCEDLQDLLELTPKKRCPFH